MNSKPFSTHDPKPAVCPDFPVGARPLDRVQIKDATHVTGWRTYGHAGRAPAAFPGWYFQRVLADGRIEIRSPSGYATAVDPMDVREITPGAPVVVRAMPRTVLVERQRSANAALGHAVDDACYEEAYVLHVTKDPWGRVATTTVWFLDASLNTGGPWNAPIHPLDIEMLMGKANRTWMPVIGKCRSTGAGCADIGVGQSPEQMRLAATGFLRYAIDRASVAPMPT